MFEKVRELVAAQLGIDEAVIKPESNFKEDLKADSLDLFELVMSLEDECSVTIPSEELEKILTVQDVVDYIEANLKNGVTELLNIEYPVIQGGMAWVADANLAAHVSKAGGMGFIGAANAPAEWVKEQIHIARKITDKPVGVNIMLLSDYADEIAQLVIDEHIEAVTTGAGNPSKYMKAWKEAGIRVIPVVASVALARMMERAGADAVVAEGMESGGHIGEETTMTLVPQVVDAVNIPVIAAGGIGDGRGVCAAFMLGAEAVQMGTRFVVAKESNVHQNYKDRVIAAKDIDSVVTGRSTGHPVRSLRNSMTREYLDMEKEGVEFEKLERLTLGTLRKAVVDGDVKQGTVMAGQIAGLVNKEQTCEEIIKELMKEVSEVYNSHNKLA